VQRFFSTQWELSKHFVSCKCSSQNAHSPSTEPTQASCLLLIWKKQIQIHVYPTRVLKSEFSRRDFSKQVLKSELSGLKSEFLKASS
jgi:hypothetical protein